MAAYLLYGHFMAILERRQCLFWERGEIWEKLRRRTL